MSKGERTREAILERAVVLFNQKGYTGVSLADIMEATGLQKGGIYNHFNSKESLAVEAFDYGFKVTGRAMLESVKGVTSPIERLKGFVRFFYDYYRNPPLTGGCIVLNTAIDADDSNPELKQRAQQAMEAWRAMICRAIRRGIDQYQIKDTVDPEYLSTVIISTLEGGIMMSKLYDDGRHVDYAVTHLLTYIESTIERHDNG